MKFSDSIPNLGRTSTGAPVVIDESTSDGTAGTILCSAFLTPLAQEMYNALTMMGQIPSEDNTQLYQILNGTSTRVSPITNDSADATPQITNTGFAFQAAYVENTTGTSGYPWHLQVLAIGVM